MERNASQLFYGYKFIAAKRRQKAAFFLVFLKCMEGMNVERFITPRILHIGHPYSKLSILEIDL